MKKVALALSLVGVLFANQKEYNYEFTPFIGGTLNEHQLGYKEEPILGFTIARNLNSFIEQVQLGLDVVKNQEFSWETDSDRSKTDIFRYHVSLVKDVINFSENTKFYGLAGIGYEDYTHQLHEKNGDNKAKDGFFGQYGLGLKHFWTDNFATKLEARDLIRFNDGSHTLVYSLGFGVNFGGGKKAPVVGDSDGDGILDNVDLCPNTPKNVVVDEHGCEKVVSLRLQANFKTNSTEVTPAYRNEIKKVADVVIENKNFKIILEGHTDSSGAAAYNKKLSEKRANAVKDVLVDMGVADFRISTVGYGEERPVASNKTAEGKAQNRRVEAKFRK